MIYSPILSKIKNLQHGFTTKLMEEKKLISIRENTATVKQVHKNHIHWITTFEKAITEADAIGTVSPMLAVGVYTADCTPILLVAINEKNQALAVMAIHAGWRGTALQIAANAFAEFYHKTKKLNVKNYIAVIGPSISKKAFEVGEEVIAAFPQAETQGIATFFRNEGEKKKYLFDLAAENSRQIQDTAQRLHIPLQLETNNFCTFFDEKNYHSYRRDKEKAGRILSFISFT